MEQCPVCGAPRGEGRACAQCGATFAPAVEPPTEPEEPTARLERRPMPAPEPVLRLNTRALALAIAAAVIALAALFVVLLSQGPR